MPYTCYLSTTDKGTINTELFIRITLIVPKSSRQQKKSYFLQSKYYILFSKEMAEAELQNTVK